MDSITEAIRQLREKRKNHVMTSEDYATAGAYDSPTRNCLLYTSPSPRD